MCTQRARDTKNMGNKHIIARARCARGTQDFLRDRSSARFNPPSSVIECQEFARHNCKSPMILFGSSIYRTYSLKTFLLKTDKMFQRALKISFENIQLISHSL